MVGGPTVATAPQRAVLTFEGPVVGGTEIANMLKCACKATRLTETNRIRYPSIWPSPARVALQHLGTGGGFFYARSILFSRGMRAKAVCSRVLSVPLAAVAQAW